MPGTTSSWRVDPVSLKLTIVALGNTRVSMKQAATRAVDGAGRALRARVRSNVMATAYSLEALAAKDHPYARRHGEILSVFRKRTYMIDSRHAVHTRTGQMVQALYGGMRAGGTIAYDLGFDLNHAPHIRYVLEGTKYMLPRDPLWQTANAPETVREMRLGIVRALGKALRSQAAIRFSP